MDYKKLIFDSCGYDFDMDIEIYEADALEVSVKGTAARIGYKDIESRGDRVYKSA